METRVISTSARYDSRRLYSKTNENHLIIMTLGALVKLAMIIHYTCMGHNIQHNHHLHQVGLQQ